MQASPPDLAVLTCLFFPFPNPLRAQNYAAFAARVAAHGVPLYTVELSLEGQHVVPASELVLHLSEGSVLWQKERLLNLLLARVPARYQKIGWLDADVVFENPAVFSEAAEMLERYAAVQLFHAVRSEAREAVAPPEELGLAAGERQVRAQYGLVYGRRTGSLATATSGLGWAIRREILEQAGGFYDASVIGGGDSHMYHAMMGSLDEVRDRLSPAHFSHYCRWAEAFGAAIDRRVSFVPGAVEHLYHGPIYRRQYFARREILKRHEYDPNRDLVSNDSGSWSWSGRNPRLAADVYAYFQQREGR